MNNELMYEQNSSKEKRIKPNTKVNGNDGVLSESHIKAGSLNGKVAYYSEKLKLTFYAKDGTDFELLEDIYLNRQNM